MIADPKIADFFVAGGTLRPDAPSYVKRPADDELFNLAQAGTFCYTLTARQMGKSSLMTRTERRLREAGVSTATIDLTSIGSVAIDAWYLGLLTELTRQLGLATEPEAWWQEWALPTTSLPPSALPTMPAPPTPLTPD
ncbi:MAG: AAA-like domain-containing protein [Chloroflexi bacterium]|nr:AAA-like domain-containing protein [Chloroflexota bacterium]